MLPRMLPSTHRLSFSRVTPSAACSWWVLSCVVQPERRPLGRFCLACVLGRIAFFADQRVVARQTASTHGTGIGSTPRWSIGQVHGGARLWQSKSPRCPGNGRSVGR